MAPSWHVTTKKTPGSVRQHAWETQRSNFWESKERTSHGGPKIAVLVSVAVVVASTVAIDDAGAGATAAAALAAANDSPTVSHCPAKNICT